MIAPAYTQQCVSRDRVSTNLKSLFIIGIMSIVYVFVTTKSRNAPLHVSMDLYGLPCRALPGNCVSFIILIYLEESIL